MIPRRKLGKAGPEVSIVGLGGHLFPADSWEYYEGFYGRRFIEEESIGTRRAVVEAALEGGVNLFAADFEYEATALGRIIRELGCRDEMLLTTVIDFRIEPEKKPDWPELERRVIRMLGLLETDRIDLPQIRVTNHYLENGLLDDLCEKLNDLNRSGKIGEPVFYAPDKDESILIHGLKNGHMNVILRAFGLINPSAMKNVLPAVMNAEAGFIGIVPFQKGKLFDCGREAGFDEVRVAETGLGWVLSNQGVTSVLCGSASPGEVRTNIAAASNVRSNKFDRAAAGLIRTDEYDRFIGQVKQAEPGIAYDWREFL